MKPQRTPPGAPRWVRPLAAPFPPPGPPRRVPRLPRYYGAVRLPVPLSPDSVAFARQYPASRLSFRSRRSRSPNRGPGVRHPVPTAGKIRREAVQGLPGSRGILVCLRPALRPRQDRRARPYSAIGTAPVMSTTKAPTIIILSGLHHTALALAVYASSRALLRATQDSLPTVGQLCGAGLDTRRIPLKGFRRWSSSFLELYLAQGHSSFPHGQ